jgi:cytochrome d ubiquinol oxidase subunit I
VSLPPALNLMPVPGNLFTNGLAVAVLATLHIQIATFITGGSTLAVISEGIAMVRDDDRHERFAQGMVRAMAYVFSFGGAVAIFWMLWILMALWGRFFVDLSQITLWMFIFESGAFLVEIILLYTLYANWDRLRRYRRARLGMLVLLTVVDWFQMFFINVVATFMLTPNGGDTSETHQILNPTFLPLQIHRTVGNIAWSGAVIAFYAGLRYLWATRRSARAREAPAPVAGLAGARSVGAMSAEQFADVSRTRPEILERLRFWDWLGQWGVMWAVGLSLFQIWIGYSYAKEIQLHAYSAWFRMMFGALSPIFLTQIFLLGSLFTLGNLYFLRRMRASGNTRLVVQRLCLVVLVLATLLAIQPAWFALQQSDVIVAHLDRPWWDGGLYNPIGDFIPYKVFALVAMMLAGLVSLTSYLRAYAGGRIVHGDTTRRLQAVLLIFGVTVSVMMAVMGVIRENGRQPYLIHGEMTIANQQIVTQPGAAPPAQSPSR